MISDMYILKRCLCFLVWLYSIQGAPTVPLFLSSCAGDVYPKVWCKENKKSVHRRLGTRVRKFRSLSDISTVLCDWTSTKIFFYNVFRATEYKTTPLPAALNRARRIDTLLWNCIVMHCINRSRIYWRPSLFMYYDIDEDKSRIQINLQASYRLFFSVMKYRIKKYMRIHLCQCSNLSCNVRCQWCLYLLNLQYSMPDTLLCYITIQYFIFWGFLVFYTIRKQNIGGAYCCRR